MSFWRLSTRLRLGQVADTRLSRRWLLLARLSWVVLVLFLVGVSIASLPTSFALLHQPCHPTVTQCDGYGIGFPTARDMDVFSKSGFSRDAYAWFWLALTCVTALVLFGVGGLLFWRRSDDWIALLVALMCISMGATIMTNDLDTSQTMWGVLGNTVLFMESQAILFTLALFPNGRFVPRWALWVALVYPIYVVFYLGFLNQLHLPGWTLYTNPINGIAWFGCWIILTCSQLYRYLRISNTVERQQTKWVAFSFVAVLIAGYVTTVLFNFFIQQDSLLNLLAGDGANLLFSLIIPVSIVLAIMRSHLWEIDTIINKALVYGLLSALLAAIYFGLVLGLQALLGGLLHQTNAIALVISTLTIAALFRPMRHRLQAIIDRRFYRHKYDAATILAAFSTTLRNEVDLSQLSEALVAVVKQTMQPAHVSLWLRPPAPDSQRSPTWSDPHPSQGGTKA